jgi:carbon starvation protein
VVTEALRDTGLARWGNKYAATALAGLTAAGLAFATGADGKGALKLWPMFGAVNQLLAALALLLITVYLRRRKPGPAMLVAGIPCVALLAMTIWAVWLNELSFLSSGNLLLATINGTVLVLALWMVAEATLTLVKAKPMVLADQGA